MLEIKGLKVNYDGIQAIRGIDVTVEKNEMVALIGANGAGKTTLLKTVSGLLRPAEGEITFEGRSITGTSAEQIARNGLVHVPEGRHVFPRMTVRENLQVAAWGRRKGVAEDIDRVNELFPVLAERQRQHAYTLSGGEQQMLALGRALMRQPRLLMLDEPSMGLAPLITREVFSLISTIHAEGTSILLVEQNAQAALELTSRAYVIATGEIVGSGASSELVGSEQIRRVYLGEE